MTRRLRRSSVVPAAFVLMVFAAARSSAPTRAAAWSHTVARHSVGKQLPRGFVLPSADADLKISSLVAADVDADGDLDIVAADPSNGSVRIVVWVNDGAGRLTRESPLPTKTLGSEPAAPSVDHRGATTVVLIQPNTPAVGTTAADARLWLPPGQTVMPPPFSAPSATPSTLRSRSPPDRA